MTRSRERRDRDGEITPLPHATFFSQTVGQTDTETQNHHALARQRKSPLLSVTSLFPSFFSSLSALVSFTHYERQNSAIRTHLPAVAERQLHVTVAQPETISSRKKITAFLMRKQSLEAQWAWPEHTVGCEKQLLQYTRRNREDGQRSAVLNGSSHLCRSDIERKEDKNCLTRECEPKREREKRILVSLSHLPLLLLLRTVCLVQALRRYRTAGCESRQMVNESRTIPMHRECYATPMNGTYGLEQTQGHFPHTKHMTQQRSKQPWLPGRCYLLENRGDT